MVNKEILPVLLHALTARPDPPDPLEGFYFPKTKRFGTPKAPRVGPKIKRNDACPCGCGKKYKKCPNTKAGMKTEK